MTDVCYICSETSDSNESISKFLHDDDDSSATEIESPTKKSKTSSIKREETPGIGLSSGAIHGHGLNAGFDETVEDGI